MDSDPFFPGCRAGCLGGTESTLVEEINAFLGLGKDELRLPILQVGTLLCMLCILLWCLCVYKDLAQLNSNPNIILVMKFNTGRFLWHKCKGFSSTVRTQVFWPRLSPVPAHLCQTSTEKKGQRNTTLGRGAPGSHSCRGTLSVEVGSWGFVREVLVQMTGPCPFFGAWPRGGGLRLTPRPQELRRIWLAFEATLQIPRAKKSRMQNHCFHVSWLEPVAEGVKKESFVPHIDVWGFCF